MQQCGSALSTHISPPPWTSLPPTAPHPSPLGCHRAWGWTPWAMKQLSLSHLLYTWQSLYSGLLSQSVPPSPSLSVLTSLFSTSAFLFLPLKEVHQGYFSRFHTYVLIYNICFSLPDLLCVKGSRFVHLSSTDSDLFLFIGLVIFYCMYVLQHLYPLIYWLTSRLRPCPGHCK